MSLNKKFILSITIFTGSKFLLQFSSLVFLLLLIPLSEYLFNNIQYLVNFSNILSYPAITISTIIIASPNYFKNFVYANFGLIKKTVIIFTCLTSVFLLNNMFSVFEFNQKFYFNFLWISLNTANVYLFYFLISICVIFDKYIIPIFSLILASFIRLIGPLIFDQYVVDIPISSIFMLPCLLLLSINAKIKNYKFKKVGALKFEDEKFKEICVKGATLFLFTVWQYLDFFIILPVFSGNFDTNYGFLFLIGKVGFSITVTIFYSVVVLLKQGDGSKLKSIQFLLAFLICAITYIGIYISVTILAQNNFFEVIGEKNNFNDYFLFSVLTVNLMQSFVYYLIIQTNPNLNTIGLLFAFVFFYIIILFFSPVKELITIFILVNLVFFVIFTLHSKKLYLN